MRVFIHAIQEIADTLDQTNISTKKIVAATDNVSVVLREQNDIALEIRSIGSSAHDLTKNVNDFLLSIQYFLEHK